MSIYHTDEVVQTSRVAGDTVAIHAVRYALRIGGRDTVMNGRGAPRSTLYIGGRLVPTSVRLRRAFAN